METRCNICLKNIGVTLEDINLGLYRCNSCGHVFKDIPKERQEKYIDDYFLKTHKNWFNNPDYALFEYIHREILRLKGNKHLRVLDVGCGNGSFLKYLRGRNPQLELYGIDLINNEYPGIKFIRGDILEEDIGMKFDVIVNITVIEHIGSPHLVMKKLCDHLVPGGIIFTVTVNDSGLIFSIARLFKKLGIDSPYNRLYSDHHLQCFSIKSLKVLMEKYDLDVIMQRKHNYPIKAVDYPEGIFLTMKLYRIGVRLIFSLSAVLNNGINQTVVGRKAIL